MIVLPRNIYTALLSTRANGSFWLVRIARLCPSPRIPAIRSALSDAEVTREYDAGEKNANSNSGGQKGKGLATNKLTEDLLLRKWDADYLSDLPKKWQRSPQQEHAVDKGMTSGGF
jgi:hypothetical protein